PQMRIEKIKAKKYKEFDFPAPMYFVAKFFHEFPFLANIIHNLESSQLRKKLERVTIDRPIYVTGQMSNQYAHVFWDWKDYPTH
ncbi:MAG: hypothetical protein JSU83_12070, partial [Deltaproteobacteria bacterium]